MTAIAGVVGTAGSVIGTIENLFGGSNGFPSQKAIIDGWVANIQKDPNGAQHGDPRTNTAAANYLQLRDWSGDATACQQWQALGHPEGSCGCEVAHGCRAYAQAAVATIKAQIFAGGVAGDVAAGAAGFGNLTPLASSSFWSTLSADTGLPVTAIEVGGAALVLVLLLLLLRR